MKQRKRKRIAALMMAVTMVVSSVPVNVLAEEISTAGVLCEHHPAHTPECGYAEAAAGTPCAHVHGEECYTWKETCVHEHTEECYPQTEAAENQETPDPGEKQADTCIHVCSEESGCITKVENCVHMQHDENCGFSEEKIGSPCTYVCEKCNSTGDGSTEATEPEESTEPAESTEMECTCEALCTEGSVNANCPVCGAEGADLTACTGSADNIETDDTIIIYSWEWADAENLRDGELALPGVSKEYPAEFEDITALLPTGIKAWGEEAEEENVLTPLIWESADFVQDENGNYPTEGEYTFTAVLPEGYVLAEEAEKPEVRVIVGGGNLLAEGVIVKNGIKIEFSDEGEVAYEEGSGFQITADGNYIISGTWQATESSPKAVITVSDAANVSITVNELTIDVSGIESAYAFDIRNGADATVTLTGSNILKSGKYQAGLQLSDGSNLTIQSNDDGSLDVTGGWGAAGIGSGYSNSTAGAITITGGSVTATGGDHGAGIGSGYYNSTAGDITITGGSVTATGGDHGAGIGSGYYGTAGDITITGGSVQAIGGYEGAGIGSGYYNSTAVAITITGGSVDAKGGEKGAGIGSGHFGTAGAITITGGSVKATGGSGVAGLSSNPTDGTTPVYLGIVPEIKNATDVSVDGVPYYIAGNHAGDDKLYLYMTGPASGGPHTVTIRKEGGSFVNYESVSYNSGGNFDNGYFTFENSSNPNMPSDKAVVAFDKEDNYTAEYGQTSPVSVTITVNAPEANKNTRSMRSRAASMDSVLLTVLADAKNGDSRIVRTARAGVKDGQAVILLDVSGLDAGDYTLEAEYGGSTELLSNTAESILEIMPARIDDDAEVTLDIPAEGFIYNGSTQKPNVTVQRNGVKLKETKDYAVSYKKDGNLVQDPVVAGEYTVVVRGIENYTGEINLNQTFTINKADPAYTTPANLTATYGQTLKAVLLPNAENGVWIWDNPNQSVGDAGVHGFKATFRPNDTDNYNVVNSCDVEVTVQKVSFPELKKTIQMVREHTDYTEKIDLTTIDGYPSDAGDTPVFTVTSSGYDGLTGADVDTNGKLTLVSNAGSSVDSDTVTVSVTEMGNYEDSTITVTVEYIDKTSVTLSGVSVAGVADSKKTYDGIAVSYTGTPTAQLTDGGTDVTGSIQDYTYTWYKLDEQGDAGTELTDAPKDAGSYKLVVAVSETDTKYKGKAEVLFTIEKAELDVILKSPFDLSYGDKLPNAVLNDLDITGLAQGETAEVLDVSNLMFTFKDDSGSEITDGKHLIEKGTVIIGGLAAQNYSFVCADGSFSISQEFASTRPYDVIGESNGGSGANLWYSGSITVTPNADAGDFKYISVSTDNGQNWSDWGERAEITGDTENGSVQIKLADKADGTGAVATSDNTNLEGFAYRLDAAAPSFHSSGISYKQGTKGLENNSWDWIIGTDIITVTVPIEETCSGLTAENISVTLTPDGDSVSKDTKPGDMKLSGDISAGYTLSFTIPKGFKGIYRITAADTAGNEGVLSAAEALGDSGKVVIDTEAPEISVTLNESAYNAGTANKFNDRVSVEITVTENTASSTGLKFLTYQLDGENVTDLSDKNWNDSKADQYTSGKHEINTKGAHTMTITVTDQAGNSTEKKISFDVYAKLTVSIAPAESIVFDGSMISEDADFTLNKGGSAGEVTYSYKEAGKDDNTYQSGLPTNAGIYEIKAEIEQDDVNYYQAASVTQDITIIKKVYSGSTEKNVSFLCVNGSKGEQKADFAALLPEDKGTVTFEKGTETDDGNILTVGELDETAGVLTYTAASGAAGQKASVTVRAVMQNYEDVTLTLCVELLAQKTVKLQNGSSVTASGSLTYGDRLSKLLLNDSGEKKAVFVDESGKEVEGTLAWLDGTAIPNAGEQSVTWKFTPDSDEYAPLTDTLLIKAEKATPEVAVPTVEGIIYNPGVTLDKIVLKGENGTWNVGSESVEVEGSWSFTAPDTIPTADNSVYEAVFKPSDTANYNTVKQAVTVTVSKAKPYILTVPAAEEIIYGQTVGDAALKGGKVQYSGDDTVMGYDTEVSGSFAWDSEDAGKKPTAAADSGNTKYTIIFTPTDRVNYETIETSLTLIVQKADAAPNFPEAKMNVSNSCRTLKDVKLPEGWEWKTDQETALIAGGEVKAVAVYAGTDKENYNRKEVEISVYRASSYIPPTPPSDGLHKGSDGKFYYYKNGVIDKKFEGIVEYDGGEFFVRRGTVALDISGLCLWEGTWYFFAQGQIQRHYTGLAFYDGEWFYLEKGVLDTKRTGIVPYDGSLFIVVEGRIAREANGLWQDPADGTWYFAAMGQIQTQHTGVAAYDGAWFYIRKGLLATDFYGTLKYNGVIFKVVAGQLYRK